MPSQYLLLYSQQSVANFVPVVLTNHRPRISLFGNNNNDNRHFYSALFLEILF